MKILKALRDGSRSWRRDRTAVVILMVGLIVAAGVGFSAGREWRREGTLEQAHDTEIVAGVAEGIFRSRIDALETLVKSMERNLVTSDEVLADAEDMAQTANATALAYAVASAAFPDAPDLSSLCAACATIPNAELEGLMGPAIEAASVKSSIGVHIDPVIDTAVIAMDVPSKGVVAMSFPLAKTIMADTVARFLPDGEEVTVSLYDGKQLPPDSTRSASRLISTGDTTLVVTTIHPNPRHSALAGALIGLAVALLALIVSVMTHIQVAHKRSARELNRLREVWELPIGVYLSTWDGFLVDANEHFLDLFGFASKEAAIGKPVMGLYQSPNDRERLKTQIHYEGVAEGFEVSLVGVDGRRFPARVSASRVDATNMIRGTVQDVTAEVEARVKFQALFDSAPVPVFVEDFRPVLDGLARLRASGITDIPAYMATNPAMAHEVVGSATIVAANPAMVSWLGLEDANELLVSSAERNVLKHLKGGEAAVAAILAGKETSGVTQLNMDLAGKQIVVQVHWSVPSAAGQPDYSRVILALSDVTEIEATRRRAEELALARSRLIGTVSHELRTPLTAMTGFASLLENQRSELPEPAVDEMLGLIASTGLQMGGLIDDLLTTTKAEMGEMALSPTALNLRDEVAAAVKTVDTMTRRVDLIAIDTAAWADAGRVRQIVRNLINNAVRYGQGTIRVETASDGVASVRISDEGPGVPPEHAERIFERDWSSGGNGHKQMSMGVGLYLSRDFARRMGGDLVYRRDGERTVFELTLPTADLAKQSA